MDPRKPDGLRGARAGWRGRCRRAARWGGLAVLAVCAALLLAAAWRARLEAPAAGILLRDRDGRFLGEIGSDDAGEFGYWPLPTLPPRVVAATLAVEDRRFRSHPGVDPLAVGRAALQNIRLGRRVSGASTIAMQVARMQEPGARSWPRKAVEAATAVMLTARYGRDDVLGHYLRIAPYGNRIHGIACAARRYFDKPIEDLSWAETAFLAALPQAPGRMNPYRESGRRAAIERGGRILDLLFAGGELTALDHRVAVEQLGALEVPPRERRPASAIHAVLRLARELGDPAARAALASRGPVTTTLDLDLQAQVERAAASRIASWENRGAGNAAVVVVEKETREVLAWVGSTGYFDSSRAGAIDFAAVPRSPGSILKPFLYALALDRRIITPATILDDLRRGPGGISNADDQYLGPLLPRVALANSRNVPAAELLGRIGIDEGGAFFKEIGLDEGDEPARRYGLGLSIGGMPVRLERLVRAYGALADEGRLADLVWYKEQPRSPARRIVSEETARQVTLFLSDPMARLPSFPRMGSTEYPYPVAVKTGTSSNYRDAWAVAWSRRYIVGVWVGDPSSRPMNHLSGFNSAASLAREVMNRLSPEDLQGMRDLSFPPPRGFHPVRVCAMTGRIAGEACSPVFLEWFRPGEEPLETCRAHVRLGVDVRDGLLATQATPRRFLEVRGFIELGPRYAAWAAGAGLARPPSQASRLGGERPDAGAQAGYTGAAFSQAAQAWAGSPFSGEADATATGGSGRSADPSAGAGADASAGAGRLQSPPSSVGSTRWKEDFSAARARSRETAGFPAGPSRGALTAEARVRVTSPENGVRLMRDPEAPPALSTLALSAVVDPPAAQVVWYVDGSPFRVADFPYDARWPLAPGEHVFEARIPATRIASRPVRVQVQ